MMKEEKNYEKREVHSTVVRAGKRTYFFDVKSTRNDDLYLTITESKRHFEEEKPKYTKHKIFLYKEDFEKFDVALKESIEKIEDLKSEGKYAEAEKNTEEKKEDLDNYSSVDFEDLS